MGNKGYLLNFVCLLFFMTSIVMPSKSQNVLGDDFGSFEGPATLNGKEYSWEVDSAGLVNDRFTFIEGNAATGNKSLRFFVEGALDNISVKTPYGMLKALELKKGSYLLKFKVKKTFSSTIKSLAFRFTTPFVEVRFTDIAKINAGEWTLMSDAMELPSDAVDSTCLNINIRNGFFPEDASGTSELIIDDIELIPFTPCVKDNKALINTCYYDFEIDWPDGGKWSPSGDASNYWQITSERAYSGIKSLRFATNGKPKVKQGKMTVFGCPDSFKGLRSGGYKLSLWMYIEKNECVRRLRVGPDCSGKTNKFLMMNINMEGLPTGEWVKYETTFRLASTTAGDDRIKFYSYIDEDFYASGEALIYFDKMMIEKITSDCTDDPDTYTNDCFWGFENPLVDGVGWNPGSIQGSYPFAITSEKAASGNFSLKASATKGYGSNTASDLQWAAPEGGLDVPAGTVVLLEMDVFVEPGTTINPLTMGIGNPLDYVYFGLSSLPQGEWVHLTQPYKIPPRGTDGSTKLMLRCPISSTDRGVVYIDNVKISKAPSPTPDPNRILNSCVYDFSAPYINENGEEIDWKLQGVAGNKSMLYIKAFSTCQTGYCSLRYNTTTPTIDAIAYSPVGSLNLQPGSYDLLLQTMVYSGNSLDTIVVKLKNPSQEIYVPINNEIVNEWQLIRVPFDQVAASDPTDQMQICFNAAYTESGKTNTVFIDRVMVVNRDDPAPVVETKVEEVATDKNVCIYPNPAIDVLNIEGEEVQTITVYNMNGQMVCKQIKTAEPYQINVSNLTPGIYMIRLQSEKGVQVKPLYIQK